jgi:hypothetical protein
LKVIKNKNEIINTETTDQNILDSDGLGRQSRLIE